MTIVLHDTHHRSGYRCHQLSEGDVRLVEQEGGVPPHGDATIEHYEQWRVVSIDKRARKFLEERDGVTREIAWDSKHNCITVLADGPDPLYASTQELRDAGWALAKKDWGVS